MASELATRGEAHLHNAALKDAAEAFQAAIDQDDRDVEALCGLARIAIVAGRLEQAGVFSARAVKLAPQSARARCVEGALSEANGNLDQAIASYQQAKEADTDSYLARFNLGRAHGQAGRWDEAKAELEAACQLAPKKPEVWSMLAVARRESGNLGGAIQAITKALELNAASLDAYLTLADLLTEGMQLEAAEEALRQGLSVIGEQGMLLDKLAAVLVKKGDVAGAVEVLKKQVTVEPDNLSAYLNLSTFAQLRGDLQTAEQAALALVAKAPARWEGHYHLGNIYDACDLVDKAEASFDEAIRLDTSQWRPAGNLGYLLCSMRDQPAKVERGIGLLETAAKLAPAAEVGPRWNLALARLNRGEKDAAKALIESVKADLPAGNRLLADVERALKVASS